MTSYIDDKGQRVEVVHGLADWWIVARGRKRVKSPALPPRKTAAECQQDLDLYAAEKGWRKA